MSINGTYILEKNGENFDKLLEAWGVPSEVISKVMGSRRRMTLLDQQESQVTVHSEFAAEGCDFDSSRPPLIYTLSFDKESILNIFGVEMKINQKLSGNSIKGSATLSGKEMMSVYVFSDDGFTFTGTCDGISAQTIFKRQ
ncbi:unnamed protein product [Meganyctiphanes norvegica]|uniref:Uncharacterized protein n=1 Tax=Meganyctiphanes norvegica TaxID=48144 RepID=A0AAV2RBQ8_MEGNR